MSLGSSKQLVLAVLASPPPACAPVPTLVSSLYTCGLGPLYSATLSKHRFHSPFQTFFNTGTTSYLKPHERKISWEFPLTESRPVCSSWVFSNSWQGPAGRFLDYCMCLGLSLQAIFHSLWPTWAFLRQNTEGACDLHALHPQTYRSSHAGRGYLRQQVIQHRQSPSWSTRRGMLFWWLWASHSNSKALHVLAHKMWQIKSCPPYLQKDCS